MDTLASSPERPNAVAVKDGRIQAVGGHPSLSKLRGPRTQVIDCHGGALLPGFHDAHCHLLSLASSLTSIDCGPTNASTIPELIHLLRRAAKRLPPDRWVKARGYDHLRLGEKRHPLRGDLDAAVPRHPLRLEHRSGHATVLNTRAMQLLGITRHTPDPPQGVIMRDAAGDPTGLFLEMSAHISELAAPYRDQDELLDGVARANSLLLSRGVTSIQDAGPDNTLDRWRLFQSLKQEARLVPRITMMVGRRHAPHFIEQGLVTGSGDDALRIGAVKFMLTLTTGHLYPSIEDLAPETYALSRAGFQLAFHAVEEEAIIAAARLIAATPASALRHRIEHCSEGTPSALAQVRQSGAIVVTNPGFIYHRGDAYLSSVSPRLLPCLYPLASLAASKIKWAASSDAPVSPPDPLTAIYAAVTRRTGSGEPLGRDQAIPVVDALAAWTSGAAYSCHQETRLGAISPAKLADLVLLDRDPTEVPPEQLKDLKAIMTVAGGRIAWQA